MDATVKCKVTEAPILIESLFSELNQSGHGAQNFFVGKVRDRNHGKDVTAVEYDAAVPLAEKELSKIAREAQDSWGKEICIRVQHRIGRLLVGEVSVAIGVSSPHRDESYLASRYIIEQIKVRVPIWKREFYNDGQTEWLKGHALCQHA